jgi:hypothetical protein
MEYTQTGMAHDIDDDGDASMDDEIKLWCLHCKKITKWIHRRIKDGVAGGILTCEKCDKR